MSEGETILAFKAGKAARRGNTNFVDASPTKGAVILSKGDDDLLHFIWKNRETNVVEEVSTDPLNYRNPSHIDIQDLILFPTDATFTKVSQSAGRVYVLKFSSSDQRHFVSLGFNEIMSWFDILTLPPLVLDAGNYRLYLTIGKVQNNN